MVIRYERKTLRNPQQVFIRAVCACGWFGCWYDDGYSDSGDRAEQSAAAHREQGCREGK